MSSGVVCVGPHKYRYRRPLVGTTKFPSLLCSCFFLRTSSTSAAHPATPKQQKSLRVSQLVKPHQERSNKSNLKKKLSPDPAILCVLPPMFYFYCYFVGDCNCHRSLLQDSCGVTYTGVESINHSNPNQSALRLHEHFRMQTSTQERSAQRACVCAAVRHPRTNPLHPATARPASYKFHISTRTGMAIRSRSPSAGVRFPSRISFTPKMMG